MKKFILESKHLEDKPAGIKTGSTLSQSNITDKLNQMQIDSNNPGQFYLDRENEVLIHNYGPDIYEYSKELETLPISSDILKRHKIDPNTRTKMVDWMVEVLYAYNSDPPTMFLAVHIMDLFFAKSKSQLSNNDIHLIGIVSLYIASKMEDIIPLRMSHVKVKIGHNKFSEKEIKRMEKLILETINFDVITTSTYDFVKTFIFDFCHNNRDNINHLNLNKILDSFDSVTVYLSKLVAHTDEFCHFK
jgi:cyclin B